MMLTLEITGPEASKLGATSRKVFDAGGGTIGRRTDNDWVLPDRYVSALHARIQYENGVYYLVDESANGVCINSPENHLVGGQPYPLKSGDWILIDPYEIRVSIAAESKEPARAFQTGRPFDTPPQRGMPAPASDPFAANPFAESRPPVPRQAPSSSPPGLNASPEPLSGDDVDPLKALGFTPTPTPAPDMPRAADLHGAPVLSEHYRAPVVPEAELLRQQAGLIPDDYDPLKADSGPHVLPPSSRAVPIQAPSGRAASRGQTGVSRGPESKPQAPRSHPQPHAAGGGAVQASRSHGAQEKAGPSAAALQGDGSLADVLVGAGLEGVAVTPELARTFGKILRVVVSGVMDVLQARQGVKEEFRMDVTTFRRADNNPLKFSANVEDALHNLLVKRNAAYLGPVDAFEDAFDDLRHHQMAMLAGMRVAFHAMVSEFDPDRLQDAFDRKKSGALISVPAKLRYWELYSDRFNEMVKDPEASFQDLFGAVFARAYQEQLVRLRAEAKARKA